MAGVLTSSGTPTFNADSTCTMDSTDLLQAATSLINVNQGWVAARIKPSWASGSPPTSPRIFDMQAKILLFYASGGWSLQYVSAATITDTITSSHSAGDHITVIGKWTTNGTTGLIKVSINGAAFDAGQAITTAAAAPTDFSIGNRTSDAARPLTGDFYWMIGGTGDPTDGNASTINGFGDTDPAWGAIPASPNFLWYARDLTYLTGPPSMPHSPSSRRLAHLVNR